MKRIYEHFFPRLGVAWAILIVLFAGTILWGAWATRSPRIDPVDGPRLQSRATALSSTPANTQGDAVSSKHVPPAARTPASGVTPAAMTATPVTSTPAGGVDATPSDASDETGLPVGEGTAMHTATAGHAADNIANDALAGGGGALDADLSHAGRYPQSWPDIRGLATMPPDQLRVMQYVQPWELGANLGAPPNYMTYVPSEAQYPNVDIPGFHNSDYSYNLAAITWRVQYDRHLDNGCGFISVYHAGIISGRIDPHREWYWDTETMGYRTAALHMAWAAPDIANDVRLTRPADMYVLGASIRLWSASEFARAAFAACEADQRLAHQYPYAPHHEFCVIDALNRQGMYFFALVSWNPVLGVVPPSYQGVFYGVPKQYRGVVGHWVQVYGVERDGNGAWLVRYYDPFLDREVLQWVGDFLRGWADYDFTFVTLRSGPPPGSPEYMSKYRGGQ